MKSYRLQKRTAWLIEDNDEWASAVRRSCSQLGISSREFHSQSDFIDGLAEVETGESEIPDLAIVDLRLPWASQDDLIDNALIGGIGCLTLLRARPQTATIPIIVHSAFIKDELIGNELLAHQPLTMVDKLDAGRLSIAIQNLLPGDRIGPVARFRRYARQNEVRLIRIGKVVSAISAISAALVLIAHHTGLF